MYGNYCYFADLSRAFAALALGVLVMASAPALAGVRPPDVVDPRDVYRLAQSANSDAHRAGVAACKAQYPKGEQAAQFQACASVADRVWQDGRKTAKAALNAAMPAWEAAVDAYAAEYDAARERCDALTLQPERKACKKATDSDFGKSHAGREAKERKGGK
jgi:hypothetical protein